MYFARKEPIKVKIWEFWVFSTNQFSSKFASILSVMTHKSSKIVLLKFYIISTKRAYQCTNLVKFHVISRESKILLFDGFLLSKSYKVSAKKSAEEFSLITLKSDAKLKKNFLVFSNLTWGVWWIFNQALKTLKISFWWALFVQSMQGLSYKIQKVYLPYHWTVMQNLNKPWPCGFKTGMRNWMNFH